MNAICDALTKNETLHHLDLRVNRITNTGVVALASYLERMRGLKSLNLGGNFFDLSDKLLEAVKVNLELEDLILSGHVKNMKDIDYYLTLNQGGRSLLEFLSHVPFGL